MQYYQKWTDYLHEYGLDNKTMPRTKKSCCLHLLLIVFLIINIIIPIGYYYIYINDERVRLDISYRDRHLYNIVGNTLTCDCAKPIVIDFSYISEDPDYFQPKYRQCLDQAFATYPSQQLATSLKGAIMEGIFVTGHISLEEQNFNNIIVNADGILNSIGLLIKIRYIDAVFNRILIRSDMNQYQITNWVTMAILAKTELFQDLNDTLLTLSAIGQYTTNIMEEVNKCGQLVEFNHIQDSLFVQGVKIDDCLPVNCSMFIKYTFYQTILLIIGFYLAVIGYVFMIIKFIYQRTTKVIQPEPAEQRIQDQITELTNSYQDLRSKLLPNPEHVEAK